MNPVPGFPTDEVVKETERNLEGVTSVVPVQHRWAESFALVFRENFLNMPSYTLMSGASKSNWTHHTAFEIRETAEILGLSCVFETMGKLDATIYTGGDPNKVVLMAEWESDCQTVFGEGRELDKLWKGVRHNKDAHALLFTYCPQNKYYDLLKQVVEFWQGRSAKVKNASSLFLLVVTLDSTQGQIDLVRTTEILPDKVLLWDDLSSP